nr:hypothetical protein TDPV-094 [Oriental turtle dovepox virus]
MFSIIIYLSTVNMGDTDIEGGKEVTAYGYTDED